MWIFLFLGILLLSLLFLALDLRLRVQRYRISLRGIRRPLRVVLLADHHSSRYGLAQRDLFAAILREEPDLVLMAGDMVDDKRPTRETEWLFQGPWPCPVYYVAGNHESRRSDREAVKAMAARCGITVLTDEVRSVTIQGQRLLIGGIEDPENRSYNPAYNRGAAMAKAFAAVPDFPGCRILIAHKPEYMYAYGLYGFDLVVSGHTHGGQVRLPGLLNGLFAPGQGLFPRFAGGVYRHGESTLVVSRGLLRAVFPPRMFNRPELVVITLVKQ